MTSKCSGWLSHDLVLPTLLFAALGAMTWAVRGCSGYGGMDGCLFAGVTWGAAWWFMARDPGPIQSRRYSSGWIILAMAAGVAVSGNRGWMQWPSFFVGHLQTNTAQGEFVPISPVYGYLWLFIAGVPWAGIGACLLAWCAAGAPLGAKGWALRLACAFGGAYLGHFLFNHFPAAFLPLYHTLAARYADLHANPNLGRLIRDNRQAITQFGFYLGCLGFETARRDRKNATLILTAGLVNGLGWALLRNWSWANRLWPTVHFNFWRCWESSAGISIGVAYGIAYVLVNRPLSAPERNELGPWLGHPHPNAERLAAYLGLLLGLGVSVKNGLKGWSNLYVGNEHYWNGVLWDIIGPLLLIGAATLVARVRRHPLPGDGKQDVFPQAYRLIWLVLITQNVLAQLVTGPRTHWSETAFSLYYLLLFALSGVILHHRHCLDLPQGSASALPRTAPRRDAAPVRS